MTDEEILVALLYRSPGGQEVIQDVLKKMRSDMRLRMGRDPPGTGLRREAVFESADLSQNFYKSLGLHIITTILKNELSGDR